MEDDTQVNPNKFTQLRDTTLVVTLATLTIQRNADYRTEVSIWQDAVDKMPTNARAHSNLASALFKEKRLDESYTEALKAIELQPDIPEAYSGLGLIFLSRGQIDEATKQFRLALKCENVPWHVHYYLGVCMNRQGLWSEAENIFQKILGKNPDYLEVYNGLGVALAGRGQIDEAIAHFRKVIEIDPKNPEALLQLKVTLPLQGPVLNRLGKQADLIRAQPNDTILLNMTARKLATHPDVSVRDGEVAVLLAMRAVVLSGSSDPASLETLAAAYAETGSFSNALNMAQKALAIAVEQKKNDLVKSINKKIKLYTKGLPSYEESLD